MLLGQRMVNSLGITGISFTGVDIGGFSGNPTPGLMVRWNSLGVYTPMFRNHAIKGSKMREPWEWGKANEQIIKKDIEQRYRLLPYIYSGFYQSTLTGLPISRTLAIEFPFDEKVYFERFQNEFMFGDALLVAPVESDKLTTDVYLPKGDWYRLSIDEKLKGGKIMNVPSPLADLPVFAKAGAIIPMQTVLQSTAQQGDGILQLHIWNGKEATKFVYYEDDGTSYDYENGGYHKRVIHFDPKAKKVTLSVVEGNFVSRFSKLKMVWHGFEDYNAQDFMIDLANDELEVIYNR